jgi:hypothetical protein
MRYKYSRFFAYLLSLISYSCSGQQLYSIPKQTINPAKILGRPSNSFGAFVNPPKSINLEMDSFEISKLVTYGEYKEYLKVIKKDSSSKFYLSQLPDTLMCLPEVYKEYTTGNKYDDYPVMGVRWEATLNYCRWKTILSNGDSIKYIYRLPCNSEWLDAYNYLNTSLSKNDFSQNYSDWLLNAFDEDEYDFTDNKSTNHWESFDYIYIPMKDGPRVLKRKRVIGDSYLFKFQSLADYIGGIYGHSDEGYRQVGFRYVKEVVVRKNMTDRFGKDEPNMDCKILKYWGLI